MFGYLKFTEQIFLEKTELISDLKWRKQIDTIILHANNIPGSIMSRKLDKEPVFQLFKLIKHEFENPLAYGRSVLLELFGTLLIIIISRNISNHSSTDTFSEKDRVSAILTYIRQHVLDNEKIKISEITKEFFMSPNYADIFIKKHAGITIQQYVIQTKMKMAERLLKQTGLTITEIVSKMNFTDFSHFTKAFKKNKSITPKKFRAMHF